MTSEPSIQARCLTNTKYAAYDILGRRTTCDLYQALHTILLAEDPACKGGAIACPEWRPDASLSCLRQGL